LLNVIILINNKIGGVKMLETRELKKNFTVRLKPSTLKDIDNIAKKYNQTKAYVIEKAVETLINLENERKD
jgi:hypothetical protein